MIAHACRLAVGLALAWPVGVALLAPELPWQAAAATGVVVVATCWRPVLGLTLAAALAPLGALLAPAPARTTELLASAFLATWLLCLHRPLSPTAWPRHVLVAGVLYLSCVLASFVGTVVAHAGGIEPRYLPVFLASAVPSDLLLFSTTAPEVTTALQAAIGLGVFFAAVALFRAEPWRGGLFLRILLAVLGALAAVTVVEVWRTFSAYGFSSFVIDRFVNDLRASRFSVHMRDLNAAGSLYALGILAAGGLTLDGSRWRWLWGVVALAIVPALWVTGSRTAVVAVLITIAGTALAARLWPRRSQATAAATVILVLGTSGIVAASQGNVGASQGDDVGSAASAFSMRWQFTQTSARMFATAPVFGVGIGQYHARSAEFMPEPLRSIYANENAHNYFAQTLAELGALGGGLFVWLLAAVLVHAWRGVRRGDAHGSGLAMLAGCAGYLLTCLTGHPLLVSEAAIPFWAVLGALAAAGPRESTSRTSRPLVIAVAVLLGIGVLLSAAEYRGIEDRPESSGLYAREVAADGTPFNWTTRHVVTYGGRTPGFVRLVLRAPDRASSRPFVVETSVGGRVVDRQTLPRDRWIVKEIPISGTTSEPFRRVDVRVNQAWVEGQTQNEPDAPARGVMAAELRWAGPGSR